MSKPSPQQYQWDTQTLFADLEKSNFEPIILPKPVLVKETEVYSQKSFVSRASSINYDHHINQQEFSVPQRKKHGRFHRNLRYTIFEVYHRLSLLIIAVNLATVITLASTDQLFSLRVELLSTAAAVNLVVAVLIRQELIINLLFALFGKCPRSLPLRIRRLAAKIYHLGGVHSGAAISGTIWFGILNVPIVLAFLESEQQYLSMPVLSITLVLDTMLLGMIILSHPLMRTKFHNTWEATHRFAGWAVVALLWVHMVLISEVEVKDSTPNVSMACILSRNPVFWCLFIITVALIIPWLRLRRLPVRAEILSDHAVRLHLGYTNLPLCAAPKFTDSPLKEWHAFAGIPEEDGVGFSILVSRAGDWTSRIIESPPRELWTKGIPARGVLHVAPIFRSLVLVATGSGIGPILSLLYARNLNARVIWSTPDPIKTYKTGIVTQILIADPRAIIIDTTRHGRPDLIQETWKLYHSSKAEAVFIISNARVTRKVLYGLESRGVPAFAPIFDS